ncbi:hypothetical protein ACSFBF_06890 [Variovorax sp. ZT5P49]|uniref:hypothetical protein n=1 Tax=Variovorax sp. ZT5P49 TaxID=3443733 RepID=UPI003F4684AD
MAYDPYNLGLGTTATNPYIGQANPNLDAVVGQVTGDLTKQFNLTAQPAYNAGMIKSGSFGNSAIDELNRNAQGQLQQSIGDAASKLRFNDYTQQQQMYQWQQQQDANNQQWNLGFGRNLSNDAYSQNMGNLQAGIGLLGTLGGYNQQDIANSTTQQNAPLNYWQQFQNAANGLANGFGSTTSTAGTTSNPLASLLGGAQLGNSWWNSRNTGTSGSGSSSSTPSTSGSDTSWWA